MLAAAKKIRSSSRRWPKAPRKPTRRWSSRCSSSATTASGCRITGAPSPTKSAFGTDYFTRTAAAKSNILVNSPNETKYFYQDLDATGARLNSANRYTVTFDKDGTPPVNGFWSLSIYNAHHFFIANAINRFSVGTKNSDLKHAADGSLTIYVQATAPTAPVNGPTGCRRPRATSRSYVRAYWPKPEVTEGKWTPPPAIKLSRE